MSFEFKIDGNEFLKDANLVIEFDRVTMKLDDCENFSEMFEFGEIKAFLFTENARKSPIFLNDEGNKFLREYIIDNLVPKIISASVERNCCPQSQEGEKNEG